MNNLFEQIDLKPFHWIYRRVSEDNFSGFYHWHQGCELLFVYRGQGRVLVNQQSYTIKPGMLFFFQPFQLHRIYVEVSPDTPYERSIMHFDPVTLGKNLDRFPGLHKLLNRMQHSVLEQQGFDLINQYTYIYEICEALNHSLKKNTPEEDSQLFLMQMLTCIRLNMQDMKLDMSQGKYRLSNYTEKMMQWIEEHYMEPFDLERLSSELHLSKSYVSRIFKRETGSSLTEYLTILRIKHACQLLQMSEEPIEIISESVGIGNISYFIQLFKKIIGTTPHQYRLSHRVT